MIQFDLKIGNIILVICIIYKVSVFVVFQFNLADIYYFLIQSICTRYNTLRNILYITNNFTLRQRCQQLSTSL